MANNDIFYNDASAVPQTFAPESIDTGQTSTDAGGTARKVRRTSIGILVGSFLDFGANTDVANSADTPTTSGLSFLRRFSNAWSQLVVMAGGIGGKNDAPATDWTTSVGLVSSLDGMWRDTVNQGQQALQSAGVGYANCNPTQATATNTAPTSPLIAARTGNAGTGRGFITLTNQGAVIVYLGASASNLTTAGFPLPPGASLTIPTTAAIYGQSASSTAVIGIVEAY